MPTTISVTLPIPPSANAIWRCQGRRVRTSKLYRQWQMSCDIAALQACVPRPRIASPCAIEIILRSGHGWRKGRDLDNCIKPVIDWLVHWSILADDEWSIVQHVSISIDTLPRAVACIDVTVRCNR
jgi:Holliday junction resolvase RusA-like endonuclease